MKKVAVTILSVLYLVTSSGATVSFHYCMGKFIGWDLHQPINNTCGNCGMVKKENKGCCNDKHQTFQLKKDQLATTANIVLHNSFQYLHTHYFSFTKKQLRIIETKSYSVHGPPGLNTSIFLFNSVFRI